MTAEKLAEYVAVILRDEIIAEVECLENKINLFFSDGTTRTIIVA